MTKNTNFVGDPLLILVMLKFSPDQDIEPKTGDVLLAEPFMDDPYFRRTVILLCEHSEEGSFGFVLNNFIDVGLDEIMNGMPEFPSKISIGGPVKNSNLYYLHTLGDVLSDSIHVAEGVFMGGNFEELKQLALDGKLMEQHVRFFVGYSGWTANQLKSEINAKSWFITEATQADIMNTQIEDLWSDKVKQLGNEYSHLANFPQNPSLN